MKLGLALPIADGTDPAGNVVAHGARDLEEHGFDSAWFFDSIGRGQMSIEPLTGAAVAATAIDFHRPRASPARFTSR